MGGRYHDNIIRRCKVCGLPIISANYHQQHCSVACSWITRKINIAARQYKKLIHCKICNKEFTKKYQSQIYCSRACYWQSKIVRGDKKYIALDYSNQYAPMMGKNNKVLAHRYIAAQLIGRPLKNYERVRHINNILTDNRPQNLKITINKYVRGYLDGFRDARMNARAKFWVLKK